MHSGANKGGLDSSGRSSARRLLPSEGSSEHQNIVAGAASSTLTVVTVKHGVDDGLGSVLKHLVLRAVLAKCLGKGTGGGPGRSALIPVRGTGHVSRRTWPDVAEKRPMLARSHRHMGPCCTGIGAPTWSMMKAWSPLVVSPMTYISGGRYGREGEGMRGEGSLRALRAVSFQWASYLDGVGRLYHGDAGALVGNLC